MSLNKAIQYGKEKRKQYTGAKSIDRTCRNHGSCEWCRTNRLHKRIRDDEAFKQAMKEGADNDISG